MPKGFTIEKNLKRLILVLIAGAIVMSLIEVFFRPKPPHFPPIEKTFPKVDIDWEILRKPLQVVIPELVVVLTVNPTSAATSSPVSLIAEVPGLIKGPFSYKFDCENDGIYELETEAVPEKTFEAVGLCGYEKEGVYNPRVEVSADLKYYLNPGEKLVETKKAEGASRVLVGIINTAPEISFCDVVPIEGTTQEDFKFLFTAKAGDLDNDPLEFKWDFGDGKTANEQNVIYNYEKPGDYLPKVSVSDGKGGEDSCLVLSLTPLKALLPFETLSLIGQEVGRENPFSPYPITPEEAVTE